MHDGEQRRRDGERMEHCPQKLPSGGHYVSRANKVEAGRRKCREERKAKSQRLELRGQKGTRVKEREKV